MRIILVYPNLTHQENISLGLASVSAVLKQAGHDVLLYDFTWRSKRDFLCFIRKNHPDLIGFSVQSGDLLFSLKMASDIKKMSAIPVIFGGVHPTIAPIETLKNAVVDYVCVGEGEFAFLELVGCLESGQSVNNIPGIYSKSSNGEPIISGPAELIDDLNVLPFSDRELYDFRKYIRGAAGAVDIISSRGCPFQCSYCINHVYHELHPGSLRIRYRSPENILQEIDVLAKKYKFSLIHFQDDAFTFKKSFIVDFCKEYKQAFSFGFTCNSRVESIDDDVCHALKEAGCVSLNLGIEHGSEKIRKEILNRQMSNNKIISAFDCAKKYKLKTYSFNMIGVPSETEETIKETIKLNQKIQPDFVQVSIFQPYPGTKLRELCLKEHWVNGDESIPFSHKLKSVVSYPQLTSAQIKRNYKSFRYKVYKKSAFKKAICCLLLDSNYNLFLKLRSFIPNFIKIILYRVSRG